MITSGIDILQQVNGKQNIGTQSSSGGGTVSEDFINALAALLFAGQDAEGDQQNTGQQNDDRQSLLEESDVLPHVLTAQPVNDGLPAPELFGLLAKSVNEQPMSAEQTAVRAAEPLSTELLNALQNLLTTLKSADAELPNQPEALLNGVKELSAEQKLYLLNQLNQLIQKGGSVNQQTFEELKTFLTNQQLKPLAETTAKTETTTGQVEPLPLNQGNKQVVAKPEAMNAALERQLAADARPIEQSAGRSTNQNNQQFTDQMAAKELNQQTVNQTRSTVNFSVNTAVPALNGAYRQPEDAVPINQLAERLVNMLKEVSLHRQNNQAAVMRLKLEPEHLGEVTVRLTYQRGELNTHIYTASVHAKEALEAALPQIRDALAQQSVKLNEAAVFLGQQGGRSGGGGYYRQPKQNRWETTAYRSYDTGTPVNEIAAGAAKAADSSVNLLI